MYNWPYDGHLLETLLSKMLSVLATEGISSTVIGDPCGNLFGLPTLFDIVINAVVRRVVKNIRRWVDIIVRVHFSFQGFHCLLRCRIPVLDGGQPQGSFHEKRGFPCS